MMLPAQRATRAPASREWIQASFGPRAFAGLGALGAMSKEEAIAILGGAQQATATKAQMDEAYAAYYGATGYYSQAPSVIRGAEEAAARREPLGEQPPPMLYGAKPCGAAEMGSTDCVSYNIQVQQANMALMENARRAWNLTVCEHNAAVNPGTNDIPCDGFRDRLPVPAVPGNPVLQQAVCTSGECYTPFIGGTDTRAAVTAAATATREFQAQYTPQGVPRVPNQTVPPRPQPGEVPALDPGAGTGTGAGTGAGSGADTGGGSAPALLFGLTANTLMIGAAALAAVFLLKGKG